VAAAVFIEGSAKGIALDEALLTAVAYYSRSYNMKCEVTHFCTCALHGICEHLSIKIM